jgi:hypothetical protein
MPPLPTVAVRRPAASAPPERRPGRPARLVAVATVVAMLGLLAGCGLRLETPPVGSRPPDLNEAARQRAGAAASQLALSAAAADPADPTAGIRALVVAQAAEHLAQLGAPAGGGTPAAPTGRSTAAPLAPTTPGPTPGPTPAAAVLAELDRAAATARADAESVPSGALARLLASVSTARLLLARQLARAAGLTGPDLPVAAVPATGPAGVSPSGLSALVAGEDEAGYGFEVIAAKVAGAPRASALGRAAAHRARAQAWAKLATIAGTGQDPRRTAYSLPAGLDDPAAATAFARSMELSVAAMYAARVADAEPASRGPLVDGVADATAAAQAWDAPVPAFPGLPERAPA